VRYLPTNTVQLVGSLEQTYLEVACLPADVTPRTTHMEIAPTHILSLVASLTPFSDFNQSPRNMYQCQMGKQTMGIPFYSPHRVDNKVYKIQTPQRPISRTRAQDEYEMDEYPTGTNAVVAVTAYTGYDMEDAMILNKSSFERGFAHASVYLVKEFPLQDGMRGGKRAVKRWFSNFRADGSRIDEHLDDDGLPPVGTLVKKGDALCAIVDETGDVEIAKHKIAEEAYIENVMLVGNPARDSSEPYLARVKLRLNRNPVIGDKFSSRHGQKGVLSILWPQVDMPFTEGGLTPDVIINPHAFPSRMTIGMLIESMAGKAGAQHGRMENATPFQYNCNRGLPGYDTAHPVTAVDHVGEQLRRAGFSYHGAETLHSGTSGRVLQAEIFFGVVYYQRLRHMVYDKFQVRTTGPMHALTHQPIKGRKQGGGIRLGEMERDSLLAHGVSFLLQDRLLHCSDETQAFVCSRCGSLISVVSRPVATESAATPKLVHTCRQCGSSAHVGMVTIPYVLKYLVNELAALGIRMVQQTTSF